MVAQQVVILFILIAVGFLCGKVNFLNANAAKKLTDIVLYIVTPCVMIKSFQREFKPELLLNLGVTALCAAAIFAGTIIISFLAFRDKNQSRNKVLKFGTVFSNCGFMALPLEQAVLGDDGVFYGSVFIAVFNIVLWTYGLCLMSGSKRELSVKKLILNPGILGVIAGLLLFLFSVSLPEVISKPVEYLAGLNTPVPMIIIGYHLSKAKLKKVFSDKWAYAVMALRLVVIPAAAVAAMYACSVRNDILVACAIACAAPTAANTTMFASKFGGDVELSVGIVSSTTLLSVLTMPLIVSLAVMLA